MFFLLTDSAVALPLSFNDAVVCADRGLAKLPKSKMKQPETVFTDSQTFVIFHLFSMLISIAG